MRSASITKIIIIFSILILFLSCYSQQIKKENLTRPSFIQQKTYVLRQMPIDFITIYNVWKHYPIDFIELDNLKKLQDAKSYMVKQKITLTGNHFIIEDKEQKTKYVLKQGFNDNSSDNITYKIYQNDNIIGTINQVYEHDFLIYDFVYKNKTYNIEGEIKQFRMNTHSFVFNIKDKDVIYGSIYKQYGYFKNEYEIIINRKYNNINDPFFISFGVFIDIVLKENGYSYK